MKKLIAITLCAVMALSFAACSNNAPAKENTNQSGGQVAEDDNVKIPNPYVECETIAEAEKLAGFTVLVPSNIPSGYAQDSIRAEEDGLVEIVYMNGENQITIRQSKGSNDISGDYNEYAEKNTLTVGRLQVSTRGSNGKVNVVTWVDGEFTFAISASPDGSGLDNTAVSDMISSMQTEGNEQIADPYVECETIADAEKIAGFNMTLPKKTPEGYVQGLIQAMKDEMIQVDYENGEKGMQIRKAKGNGDISGDYNEYAEKKTLTVGSLQVSARGNNGKVNVATWVDGEFSYSISGAGFDTTAISDMVSGIR